RRRLCRRGNSFPGRNPLLVRWGGRDLNKNAAKPPSRSGRGGRGRKALFVSDHFLDGCALSGLRASPAVCAPILEAARHLITGAAPSDYWRSHLSLRRRGLRRAVSRPLRLLQLFFSSMETSYATHLRKVANPFFSDRRPGVCSGRSV